MARAHLCPCAQSPLTHRRMISHLYIVKADFDVTSTQWPPSFALDRLAPRCISGTAASCPLDTCPNHIVCIFPNICLHTRNVKNAHVERLREIETIERLDDYAAWMQRWSRCYDILGYSTVRSTGSIQVQHFYALNCRSHDSVLSVASVE